MEQQAGKSTRFVDRCNKWRRGSWCRIIWRKGWLCDNGWVRYGSKEVCQQKSCRVWWVKCRNMKVISLSSIYFVCFILVANMQKDDQPRNSTYYNLFARMEIMVAMVHKLLNVELYVKILLKIQSPKNKII